jgi:hypothetical protein
VLIDPNSNFMQQLGKACMSYKVNPRNLRQLLEQLRASAENPKAACAAAVAAFTNDDLLVLAAWAAAATFGPSSGKLRLLPPDRMEVSDSWGKPLFQTRFFATEGVERPILIDAPWNSQDEGTADPARQRHRFDPASLALALHLIRDHIDSTLLKPRDLRDMEIVEFASHAGLEEAAFRRLAVWEPEIAPYLC